MLEVLTLIGLTIAFHLPLVAAAWIGCRHFLGSRVDLQGLTETFLAAFVLWRVELILLSLTGNVDRIAVLGVHGMLLVSMLLVTRRWPSTELPAREPLATTPGLAAPLGAAFALALGSALLRIACLPDPYDSLTYHLMLPAHWLARGQFDLFPTPFGDIAPTYTPEAVEIFFFGLMLPTGSDVLARIGQLPFLAVTLSVVTRLAVEGHRGAGKWGVLGLAPLILILWPRLLLQGGGSMVDVAAGALFLGGLERGLRWRRTRRNADLIFAGLLVGLFVSSRFTGVVFGPLALLPFLWGKTSRIHGLRSWGLLVAAVAVTGAYPYLRNAFLTGNPLYPLHLAISDWTLAPGLFTREATHHTIFHLGLGGWVELARYEFGPGLRGCLILGLLAPLWSRDRLVLAAVAIAVAMTLLHAFVVPYNSNLRFLFPAWALLAVAVVRAANQGRVLPALAWVATAFGILQLVVVEAPLALSRFDDMAGFSGWKLAGTALAGAAGALLFLRLPRRLRITAALSLMVITAAGTAGLHQHRREHQDAIERRDRRYAPYVEAWRRLRELPGPATVAYCGLNLPYPLRGDGPPKFVTTIPLDGGPPGEPPHLVRRRLTRGFRPSTTTVEITLDRLEPDRTRWKQRIAAAGVDYLAVYVPSARERAHRSKKVPVELEWARQDRRRFEELPSLPENPDSRGLVLFRVIR